MAREICRRCRRPVVVCYCAALTSIETVTRVVILQHPRERDMPIGTARMASLCLPGARLHVGTEWDGSEALREATGDPARPAILLWPGPGARDVLRDPPAGPVTLVVVDGTWAQAKSVVRTNPGLASLPRYAFDAPEPSSYRIRREPRAEYVSTIEALMHVLGALEGDPDRFRALLGPFRAMVDAQLAQAERARKFRVRRPRRKRPPGAKLPPEFTSRFGDLVCVVAESNHWPYASPENALGDELVRWTARRVATGETFDAFAAPRLPLSPAAAQWAEVPEDRIRGGGSLADLVHTFGAWTRPGDVVCAWGWHGLRLLRDAGGSLPAAVFDLRAVARQIADPRDVARRKVGTLEDYAARAGIPVSPASGPPLPPGRAGRRLGVLCALLEMWRELGAAASVQGPCAPPDASP